MAEYKNFIVGINKLDFGYEYFSEFDWNFLKLNEKFYEHKKFDTEKKAFEFCLDTYS